MVVNISWLGMINPLLDSVHRSGIMILTSDITTIRQLIAFAQKDNL